MFYVVNDISEIQAGVGLKFYLVKDGWNDWYRFTTLYRLFVSFDFYVHDIGDVKIGQKGLESGRADLPLSFDKLDENFFSLGQDASYYENLEKLKNEIRDKVLDSLNDLAKKEDLFKKVQHLDVTTESLLRSVSTFELKGRFRRLANGGAPLTNYKFKYVTASKDEDLTFDVNPNSNLPTNIHVLIGSNGVGKTYLLNNMVNSLLNSNNKACGFFQNGDDKALLTRQNLFANLVFVSFSAFDKFIPSKQKNNFFTYIGLRKAQEETENICSKSFDELCEEFKKSLDSIKENSAKLKRWSKALKVLESDPVFCEYNFSYAADKNVKDISYFAEEIFKDLSSGHKIVLLTLTRLVETTEEKTLILLDEPESHLHPPLLSAFIRALSELLMNRNGVAIIATHSPVILQEVPRECVYKIRKVGNTTKFERPQIETFGENLGVLTRDAFGYEVTRSGFHNILKSAVEENFDYEDVICKFNDKLGYEAKAIIRAMFLTKED